ncbi:hypothetical protein [Coxiella burnetii]|uniref:hypothetical protein n=1 Tax=Coxiella burnetii TaxID=777 RepID=UPI0005099835|nr:hypothetical protein [Coxiella burnetii]
MKKLIISLLLLSFSLNTSALDSQKAVDTFQQELANIRSQLQAGKMSAAQAQILLQAIQVRQNNVLIAQNAAILKRQQHESK